MPVEHSARGLVEAFPDAGGRRVRAGCCSRGGPGPRRPFADGLTSSGWDVRRVEAYRTVPRAAPEPALLDRVAAADAVTFTAPSAVQAFLALRTADGRPVTPPAHVVCIGATTAAAARAAGLDDVHEAWDALGPGHRRRADRRLGRRARPRPVGWTDGRGDVDARCRAASPCGGCGGCAARRRCGAWSPRPVSVRTTWSPRSSCGKGSAEPVPIASMPGEVQHSLDSVVVEAKRLVSLGVPGLILFGVPARKDAQGAAPGTRRAWCRSRCAPCAMRSVTSSSSWPTSASTSTPITATAASSAPPARCSTTRRSSSTSASPWPRPQPGRTWWRPAA